MTACDAWLEIEGKQGCCVLPLGHGGVHTLTAIEYEKRVELIEITEWKDGCVYKTRSHGLKWVPMDEQPPPGWQYGAISTHAPEAHEMNFRRKVPS